MPQGHWCFPAIQLSKISTQFAAIVSAATAKGLRLQMPELVHEVMGSGLEGIIAGQKVRAGSQQVIFGAHRPDDWALRALRRASWRSAVSVFVSVDGRKFTQS
jgi:cation transport ATPase